MRKAKKIKPTRWMAAPETRAVIAALAAGGEPARFVGGCVRDTVARRRVKDVDITTPLRPERVMELLVAAGLKAIPTGIDHGTVTAISGGKPFEVTTLRRDVETFGRRARVAFTDDWAADAARRDFTINALYADPDGAIYDPTSGLADLERGRVRFVGDAHARIEEDVLRLLRFFRFHAFYGKGAPDRAALAACRDMAPKLKTLSGERVRAELMRLLEADDPVRVLTLMHRHGVLRHVVPTLTNLRRLAALVKLERELKLAPDPLRRLAAGLAVRKVASFAERLRLSNAERDRLGAMLAAPRPTPEIDVPAQRRLLYRIGAEVFRDRVLLAWAERPRGDWRKLLDLARRWKAPVLPVSGRDLRALGLPQGPQLGALLARVERWWMTKDFEPGRAECLAYLERVGARHGMTLGAAR